MSLQANQAKEPRPEPELHLLAELSSPREAHQKLPWHTRASLFQAGGPDVPRHVPDREEQGEVPGASADT